MLHEFLIYPMRVTCPAHLIHLDFITLMIQVMQMSIHFQTLDLTKFLMCSVCLNMGTTSGHDTHQDDTQFLARYWQWFHWKRILQYSQFCHATHSHLHFFTIRVNKGFYKLPEERIQGSHIWRMMGPGNGSPFSYTKIRKLPVQKGTKTMA